MASRIASAAVGLPLLTLVIWIGSPWFSLLVATVAALGALELCHMARRAGARPLAPVAAAWSVALVAGAHFLASGSSVRVTLPAVAGAGALALVACLPWRSRLRAGLADWGLTAGAALYTGGLLSYGPLLRGLDQGRGWVLIVIFVTY